MSKVWFVTGGSRGLGRALVEVALEAGDRVAATARNPERLQDLLDKYGDAVLLLRLDVTDYDAAVRVVTQAKKTFGRIDVVVNNAGYSDLGSFEDTTIDSFRTQIDTNFYGVVNVSKAAVPVLREQGSGHIFQVSSLSVRFSAPGLTAYQAAKWAVAGFSSGLAQEIVPFGVKVTVLEPGGMRTDWAGSSMTIPQPSVPYRPTIGAFAELVRAGSGHEATDPRRVAQVVRDLAGRDDAPLRLLLGTDAVPMARQAAQELAASDEAWREVSLSVSDETPRTVDALKNLGTSNNAYPIDVRAGGTMTDFSDMARSIIESNRYMVLGTADEDGVPWVTPVWYAQSDHRRFIWVSSPERRHSRNVRARPEVSIVIFDSRVAVGSARAVYMSAHTEEPSGAELERDVAFFDTASQVQGLTRRWALEDVQAPAPYRLYRATVSQHWVLDPDSSPDDRADVTL